MSESRQYFWTYEGEPMQGTLADYVHAIEQAHYSGHGMLRGYVYTLEVWGGEGLQLVPRNVVHESHDPGVVAWGVRSGDHASFTVRVGDDEAHGSIDLRA